VHAGVNFQDGSFVGGVEVLADYAPFSGDDAGVGGDINGLNGQFLGTLAGRVGFAADEFFFYLSGGGAVLTAEATANTPDESDNLTFLGWTAGAGAEFAVTEDVSLRADYRYYSFGQEVATFPINTYDMGFNPSFHTVSVGVSMAF
jgi:outer membrane immunogenic protein